MCISEAIGLGFLLARKIKTMKGFFFTHAIFIWMALEHFILNYYYASGDVELTWFKGGQ